MSLFRLATADFLILLCCTSLLFHVTAALATDFNLQSRKNVDHNLDCRGGRLPTAARWPSAAPPRSSFTDLVSLCGRVAGRRTVGCLCDSPYTRVECPNTGAISLVTDQVLWQRFHTHCLQNCFCEHRAAPTREDVFDDLIDEAYNEAAARQGLRVSSVLLMPPPSQATPPHHVISRSLDATQEGICGGSCTNIAQQCSSGPTGQCKCTARPAGGARGSVLQFSGFCAAVDTVPIPIDRIGDTQVPESFRTSVMAANDTTGLFAANGDRIACPCNATYVSYSCCGSTTGNVWETPDKKLGELKVGA